MSLATKLRRFVLAVLACGTFLGAIIGSIAFAENLGDRNLGSMLVLWGLALFITAVGSLLFALTYLLVLKRLNWFSSSMGFAIAGALFGGVLSALWVLRHHLLFGVRPSEYLIWCTLGALTGLVGAFVWRREKDHKVGTV